MRSWLGSRPEVRERLAAYIADVASGLGRVGHRRLAGLYARGLIEAGARKSLEPIVARLGGGKVEYEGLQHFLADSPWDSAVVDRAVAERVCAVIEPEAWVLDDTGVPKDGKHSPGVKRQYSGTLGKIGNCQIAVSLHAVGENGTVPLGFRLYLPEEWCKDAERRRRRRSPRAWSLRPSRRSAGSWSRARRAGRSRARRCSATRPTATTASCAPACTTRAIDYVLSVGPGTTVFDAAAGFAVPPRKPGRAADGRACPRRPRAAVRSRRWPLGVSEKAWQYGRLSDRDGRLVRPVRVERVIAARPDRRSTDSRRARNG